MSLSTHDDQRVLDLDSEIMEKDEIDDLDEVTEVLPVTYSITSYGADYPVDGLVKRLDQGDIVVPLFSATNGADDATVGFQRDFVWTRYQCDRFIESLLLGLPVPGIFLVKESSGKHLVLDGQQRLKTLQCFYTGVLQGKEFSLENVQAKWRGRTYKTLHADDRRRLDDSIIHATVVRQDEPSDDQSSIYLVFERLNSGGTFLQPQEIRVALYHGPFAALLSTLNENSDWRSLYGKKSSRLKDLELILRFFAFYFDLSEYRRPMKEFLNKYMASNVGLKKVGGDELTLLFSSVVATINQHIGGRAFRLKSAVNAAIVDSIMIGVAQRLAMGAVSNPDGFAAAYKALMQDPEYITWVTRSTADEEFVRKRLERSRLAFSQVT